MRPPRLSFRCARAWHELPGDDRRRFCDGCNEHVHNLSSMTPDAARRFVDDNPRACLAFVERNGRIAFARRRLAVLATAATMAACTAWEEPHDLSTPEDTIEPSCPVRPAIPPEPVTDPPAAADLDPADDNQRPPRHDKRQPQARPRGEYTVGR